MFFFVGMFSIRDLKLSGRSEAEKAALKCGGELVDFQRVSDQTKS